MKKKAVIFLLEIKNVKKHYRKEVALDQVSLTIPKGSCFGLVGPNGAGKSTLLKILASIIQDYQGDIQLTKDNEQLKKITGYVPQEICLEQTLSAIDNLYFFGKLYGLNGKELKKRATEVLHDIGLTNRGKDKVMHLSGGMKRRLNIGCALMHNPELIIMDEPTVGIDPQSRRYIFQMIQRLQSKGCTIIYATHYMEEVEQLCDQIAFIDRGKIIESASIAGLLQKYAIPSVFTKAKNHFPNKIDEFGEITKRKDGYLIKTDTPLEVMEEILKCYKTNPKDLERLELVHPWLEDVFFTLTGSELREENPSIRPENTFKQEVYQ